MSLEANYATMIAKKNWGYQGSGPKGKVMTSGYGKGCPEGVIVVPGLGTIYAATGEKYAA